jgi:DEAD/DEAH box helicase domain-containing protein
MRRLRLAVDRLEGDSDRIQYVLAIATIGNPIELTERITERSDRLLYINRSGARAAGRTILCLKPTARTNTEASRLILEWLERGLSGIVFCNTRAGVKSLLALMNAELERQKRGHLKASLALFYGSLRSDRRNQIIEAVKQNKVRVIFAVLLKRKGFIVVRMGDAKSRSSFLI